MVGFFSTVVVVVVVVVVVFADSSFCPHHLNNCVITFSQKKQ